MGITLLGSTDRDGWGAAVRAHAVCPCSGRRQAKAERAAQCRVPGKKVGVVSALRLEEYATVDGVLEQALSRGSEAVSAIGQVGRLEKRIAAA